RLTYHFIGAVPQNSLSRIIANQDVAFEIGNYDAIGRAHNDTVKKTVRAEQLPFDLNMLGQVLEIHTRYVALAKPCDRYAGFKYAVFLTGAYGRLERAAKTQLLVMLRI